MRTRPTRPLRAVAGTIALAGAMSLSGCASPGSTTCDDYAALSSSEQSSLERSLLSSHGLEPDSVSNAAGLQSALLNFCGVSASAIVGAGSASSNQTRPIDEAVDWDATTW